jgi:hypothetical protein
LFDHVCQAVGGSWFKRWVWAILERVDQAAKQRGISRSAWIHFMISRALEQEERSRVSGELEEAHPLYELVASFSV